MRPSEVLRRVRATIQGESPDVPEELASSYFVTARHLVDMMGHDAAIKHLNMKIAKYCYIESGASACQ